MSTDDTVFLIIEALRTHDRRVEQRHSDLPQETRDHLQMHSALLFTDQVRSILARSARL